MKSFIFLIFITIISSTVLILKPLTTLTPQVAIIMMQGAECPIQTYTNMFTSIQNNSPFALWVAIPQFPQNLAVGDGTKYINQAINQLKNNGFTGVTRLFIAGHSLGGIMAQNQAFKLEYFAGIILLGSYTQRKNYGSIDKYNIPILTISGQLDGLNKIIKLAESYQIMLYRNQLRFVNYVLEGANHGIYIQGYIPPLVKKQDLPAQVSHQAAYSDLSDMINSFIVLQLNYSATSDIYKNALQKLYYHGNRTKSIIQPLVDLLQLEGYPFLPNFDLNLTWVNQQQNLIFDAGNLTITHSTKRLGFDAFVQSKTHLQKISNNEVLINMTTYSAYTQQSKAGFNSDPITSQWIGVKMKSRQALSKILKIQNNKNLQQSCKILNNLSFSKAYNILNVNSTKRYQKKGISLIFEDDQQTTTGSAWVEASVKYTLSGNTWSIKSPRLQTNPDFIVPNLAGVFYCKLASPARFAEWILIDSMRVNTDQKKLRID